jgi:hypothetical protein
VDVMNRQKVTLGVLALVGMLLLWSPAAWAAARFRRAPQIEAPHPWLPVIYAVTFVLCVCAVAFKNPRRSHLD